MPAGADVGPPAHLQITEREPGLFAVQWRVPKALPPRAVPAPEFPETCRASREPTIVDQPGAWLFTREWRCETSLAGEVVGMRFPFPALALTTVVRAHLLSGDRFAHLLTPGEGPWQIPEGTLAPDLVRGAQRAVLTGVSHALGSWVHLAFLLAVSLLGGFRQPLRVVSAFTLGQLGGTLVAAMGPGIGAVPAEIAFAVAVALLAREVLRPADKRRRLLALAGAGGLVHGLGIAALLASALGDDAAHLFWRLLPILGMDASHLVSAVGAAALWSRLTRNFVAIRMRDGLVYAAGATGMALATTLAVGGGVVESAAVASSLPPPGQSAASPTAGVAGSRRLAPAVADAPIQSFLAVEPFEIRHEAMLRLGGLAEELDLDPVSTLEIDSQPAVLERVVALVLDRTDVQADGVTIPGLVRRADFMKVDPTGALPRSNPVPESVGQGVIGVVVAYPTGGMPRKISMGWDPFPDEAVETIPATLIDPESVTSLTLSVRKPSLAWENTLAEDPTPSVAAVAVEAVMMPLPLPSLPLLALAAVVLIAGIRRRRAEFSVVAARVILALALVLGPLAQTSVALPGSTRWAPSERQARRILSGLLPNIYRAMEFRDEAVIYDRLAVSVTGETLADVYLEQRRALEMAERGGAQARVEAVEILEVRDIESRDAGFGVRSIWTVGGMVTHFGHRHFRQNRYDARIAIVPVAGMWKIESLEVLEQDRVR